MQKICYNNILEREITMDNRLNETAFNFVSNYIENLKISAKKREEIFSNSDYMNWLEFFTRKHQNFSDDSWLYSLEEISDIDYLNVINLHLLYEGVELYAKKNYIYPTELEWGNFYRIQLNKVGYEIGMAIGQGTTFFVKRVILDKKMDFIDFYDIIKDKKCENVDDITEKLNEISNRVVELYKKGVPLEALVDRLSDTLNSIKENEKNFK